MYLVRSKVNFDSNVCSRATTNVPAVAAAMPGVTTSKFSRHAQRRVVAIVVANRKKRDLLTVLTGPVFSGVGRFGRVRMARALFNGSRAGLPTAQAGQGSAAKPARHYPAQRGNDARLGTINANGWRSVFSMTGG